MARGISIEFGISHSRISNGLERRAVTRATCLPPSDFACIFSVTALSKPGQEPRGCRIPVEGLQGSFQPLGTRLSPRHDHSSLTSMVDTLEHGIGKGGGCSPRSIRSVVWTAINISWLSGILLSGFGLSGPIGHRRDRHCKRRHPSLYNCLSCEVQSGQDTRQRARAHGGVYPIQERVKRDRRLCASRTIPPKSRTG